LHCLLKKWIGLKEFVRQVAIGDCDNRGLRYVVGVRRLLSEAGAQHRGREVAIFEAAWSVGPSSVEPVILDIGS